jgi:hypothetical protein
VARLTHVVRPTKRGYLRVLAKNPYKTTTCVYCGQTATTKDHLIPRLYTSVKMRKKGSSDRGVGKTVDSCGECNLFLGSKLVVTVVDRAYNLWCNPKVQKRYAQERLDFLWNVAKEA